MPEKDRDNPQDGPESDQEKAGKSPAKVVHDEIKQRHTSHWDMDYLPSKEIEDQLRKDESDAD